MQEQLLALVGKGMDVCDMTGEKIGTVGEVYPRMGVATRPGPHQRAYAEPTPEAESYIKVDTGFLGLGKHLYIPASFISDVTDSVLVDVQRDHLEQMHLDERPPFLEDR